MRTYMIVGITFKIYIINSTIRNVHYTLIVYFQCIRFIPVHMYMMIMLCIYIVPDRGPRTLYHTTSENYFTRKEQSIDVISFVINFHLIVQYYLCQYFKFGSILLQLHFIFILLIVGTSYATNNTNRFSPQVGHRIFNFHYSTRTE